MGGGTTRTTTVLLGAAAVAAVAGLAWTPLCSKSRAPRTTPHHPTDPGATPGAALEARPRPSGRTIGGPDAPDEATRPAPRWVEILVSDERGEVVEGAVIRVTPPRTRRETQYGAMVDAVEVASRLDWMRVDVPWDVSSVGVHAESVERRQVADRLMSVDLGARVQVSLEVGVEVRGRVSNIPGGSKAWLSAFSGEWPEAPGRRPIPVADDGTFWFVAPKGLLSLYALAEGQLPSEWWSQVLAGPVPDVVLRLGGSASSVRARVFVDRASGAEPLPAGEVVYASRPGSGPIPCEIGTGGQVVLYGVEAGRPAQLRIWSARAVRGEWLNTSELLDLPPNHVRDGMEIRVRPAANTSFRATDEHGAPVVGLWLVLQGTSPSSSAPEPIRGVTDEVGVWRPFEKRPMPSQRAELRLPGVDRLVWEGVLDEAPEETVVRVARAELMQIRLVDWSGRELRSRRIRVSASVGEALPDALDLADVLRLPSFEASSVVSVPRLAGGAPKVALIVAGVESRWVDAGPPDAAGIHTVALSPSVGALRLDVRDRSGQPWDGSVAVRRASGIQPEATKSVAGTAEYVGLPPDDYTVLLLRRGEYVPSGATVRVRAGEWAHHVASAP